MNDWEETLEWYRNHTTTEEVGFNPDGMCLKLCRTARGIGAMYPSAKIAQDNTPSRARVHNVRDLRRGMVLYFDDPNDSNTFGHIVTMAGRVPDFDEDDLNDVLVWTNSVQSGKVTLVRASYFERYWGDKFVFGATWLNGVDLDVYTPQTRIQRFKRSGSDYNVRLLDRAINLNKRADVRGARDTIDKLVKGLTDDKRRTRIRKFKNYYAKHRVLRMRLLNEVVKNSPDDFHTRNIRNSINQVIKSLPDR